MLEFVGFASMFFVFLPWLHRALSCSMLLLMRRMHMFVLQKTCKTSKMISGAELSRKPSQATTITSDYWRVLLHPSTSPGPQLGTMDPQLVGRGLGTVGNYETSHE